MTLSKTHDKLAKEFMLKVVREVIEAGGNAADVMVLIESVILAGMILNKKMFNIKDSTSSAMVEEAVNNAIERFASGNNGNTKA